MDWLLFGLGAAFFWSFVALLDKFIVDREAESPLIDGIINALGIFVTLLVFSFATADIATSSYNIAISALAGFLYVSAIVVYFAGIKLEEVSRFDPIMSMDVVFILILSSFFLNEVFRLPTYAGIFLTLGGAFLISLENPLKSLKEFDSKSGVFLAMAAAFIYAVREVILKSVLSGVSEITVIFWMAVGGGIASLFVLATQHSKLREQSFSGIEHLLLSGVFTAGGFIFFIKAVSLGPVALVSTITKTRYLAIFAGSALLTRYHPEILHEELDRKIILQKTFAITMIVAGVALIAFY